MNRLGQSLASVWSAPDRRPTPEWANQYLDLMPPFIPTGYFDCSRSRHFLEPFAALDDERAREVNILKPVRGGGSLIGDVFFTQCVARRPAPCMNIYQTDADAKIHWFDREEKLLLRCQLTRDLMPARYDWSEFRLASGDAVYNSGPGISNLQSKGVCYLKMDECWIYPAGRMAEAEARVGDYLKFELSKVLRISQAGPAPNRSIGECEWHRAWQRGEQNEWEVACLHCGKYFDPIFSGTREDGSYWGMTWDQHKTAGGDWDIPKCTPTIRFECPHCSQPMLDSPRTKAEWNRTGRYRLLNEANSRRRGFHWEAVIDFPWNELVTLWLDAANAFNRGDIMPKIQFYQKRRALFRDEESILRGGLHLRKVAYEINSEWPEERARNLSIDRQDEDVFWWTVRAWSREKSRRLGFGRAFGFAECEAIREKFKVPTNHTFIDSAFVPKGDHGVYAACVKYGWIAVRGENTPFFIHHHPKKNIKVQKSYSPLTRGDPGIGTTNQNRKFAPLILFSKPQMNQLVQSLIDAGRWEEPLTGDPEMEEEYSQQMAARVRRVEYNQKTGEARVYWHETKNDHGRDLGNMNTLGAILEDLIPDPAEEKRSESEKVAA